MALKGTLKDFGIADILQLIGTQQKTGLLNLTTKEQAVVISFKDGSIVRTESSTRNKKDLIGAMLVNAALITEAQLDYALAEQKRTLKKLGDVIVEQGVVSAEQFRQLVQLQATETLYRLFQWKSGSYEFVPGEVDPDSDLRPLQAESVLMEGFRMVDEWPVVRKVITSDTLTFERLKELAPPPAIRDGFDAAMDTGDTTPDGVGNNERLVYFAVSPGRTVRNIIDLSCLGEFEATKCLSWLVVNGYLRPSVSTKNTWGDGRDAGLIDQASGFLVRSIAVGLAIPGLFFLAINVDLSSLAPGSVASALHDPGYQRVVSRQQISRIASALSVYRAEKNDLPDRLELLVQAGLLRPDDTRYPWRTEYFYRKSDTAQGYVLLPPLR